MSRNTVEPEAVGPVISRLIGGLGNQMFQYAAGRAAALRCGAALKLDLSGFDAYFKRRYELGTFPIQATVASDVDLARFGRSSKDQSPRLDRVRRLLRVGARAGPWPTYRERHFHFDPAVTQLRAPVYLDGYWQSQKYFSDWAQVLRREFTPVAPLEPENAALAARIDAVNAVSLHVRRGDYANEPTTHRYHGICSRDYYERAVEYIDNRVQAIHLFVFSDDQEWTRGNLRFGRPASFVDTNSADRGYRDMQLMARCRHHILANSSFSWWGAWLNPSREKIVIAPRRWFDAGANDTRDLIPESWVRL